MKVKPYQKTTLELNALYQPTNIWTAEKAFKNIVLGKVKAISADGTATHWFDDDGNYILNETNVKLFEDQPYLSSANRDWYVPTIVVNFHEKVIYNIKNEDIKKK